MQTQVGTRIGEYTLVRPLGSGGMGEVWLASCDGLEKPFVIKLLLPRHCKSASHRRRFMREAKLVASLPHGRIVPVVDYGEASDRLFIVMAYVDGVDLQTFCDALQAKGVQLPYYVIIYILAEILEALRDAHTHTVNGELRPVIHRDIKPSNVLISSRGGVFLTDFGIALLDNDYSLETFGTLGYMAPEQARGNSRPVPQCDIFGVGGIAHFLLTGDPPRRVTNYYELQQEIDCPPPPIGREDVPRVLQVLHASALDPRLATRAASAGDLLALLDAWEGYRRATTALMELYQRVIGGMRSGMTEMLAKAKAEAEQPRPATITMKTPPHVEQRTALANREGEQAQAAEQPERAAEQPERAAEQPERAAEQPEPQPVPGRPSEEPTQSPETKQDDEDWRPWWSDDGESNEEDDDPLVDHVTIKFERPPEIRRTRSRHLNLKGVPEEYIPRPDGNVDDDAPQVRRRPRETPTAERVDATQPLPPPFSAHDDNGAR
jgi:serine/threonine protein kinase